MHTKPEYSLNYDECMIGLKISTTSALNVTI